MFLEECKYVVKEKKYIIDDTEISSDPDRENAVEENSNRESLKKCKYNPLFKVYFWSL